MMRYVGTPLQKQISAFLAKYRRNGTYSTPSNLGSFERTDISCYGSLCPSATPSTPKEDVMSTLLKFIPDFDEREPTKDCDNYRVLPRDLWKEYPEVLRTSLDSGLIRLSELGDPKAQLEAIEDLKLKGHWHNLPLIIKFAVFFGKEDKISLADSQEQVREDMERRSLEAFKVEALASEAQERLRKLKREAEEQALKEFYTPRTEESFYNDILETILKGGMKNE